MNRFWDGTNLTKVKICNVATLETAFNIVSQGIDAIGIHLFDKKITNDSIEKTRNLVTFVKEISEVSVWLLADYVEVEKYKIILEKTKADTLQIQRKIDIKLQKEIYHEIKIQYGDNIKIVKTISLSDGMLGENLKLACEYSQYADALLLDSSWNRGGTGVSYDYSLAKDIMKLINKPVILAGGLNATNVQEIVNDLQPYGVDVQSGVEFKHISKYGNVIKVKDIMKCKFFCDIVKRLQ